MRLSEHLRKLASGAREVARTGIHAAAESASRMLRSKVFAGVLAGTAAFGAASEASAKPPAPTVETKTGNTDGFNAGLGYKLSQATEVSTPSSGRAYEGPLAVNNAPTHPTKTIGMGAYAMNIPVPQVKAPKVDKITPSTIAEDADFLAALEKVEQELDKKPAKKASKKRPDGKKDADSTSKNPPSTPEPIELAMSEDELDDLFNPDISTSEQPAPNIPAPADIDLDEWFTAQTPSAPIVDRGPMRVTVDSLMGENAILPLDPDHDPDVEEIDTDGVILIEDPENDPDVIFDEEAPESVVNQTQENRDKLKAALGTTLILGAYTAFLIALARRRRREYEEMWQANVERWDRQDRFQSDNKLIGIMSSMHHRSFPDLESISASQTRDDLLPEVDQNMPTGPKFTPTPAPLRPNSRYMGDPSAAE